MELSFTKMHGLGNDFVVLDFTKASQSLSEAQAARIADRKFGIGCDQILIVESPTSDAADFRYRILNADGSEVSQCGNGARCFVRFVHEQGLSSKNPLVVETAEGILELKAITNSNLVEVNMGVPKFAPNQIPLDAKARQTLYKVKVENNSYDFASVNMGNPHAVLLVDDVNTAPVLDLGAKLERNSLFPERANIGFMQIKDTSRIALRVFERGVGETLACGSGACAAVVAGAQQGLLQHSVTVEMLGGELQITWQGEGKEVKMTGPAETVYQGHITL